MRRNVKRCRICREGISIVELTKGKGKCSSCLNKVVPIDDSEKVVPSDDSEEVVSTDDSEECKKLKKRIKKLEKTVGELSNKLLIQETKVFGIEKMIEGFILGMKSVDNGNANIEELSDDAF